MKTNERQLERICPICGKTYRAVPALSRKDGRTLICPDCGTREALAGLGIEAEEQERILQVMHKFMDCYE